MITYLITGITVVVSFLFVSTTDYLFDKLSLKPYRIVHAKGMVPYHFAWFCSCRLGAFIREYVYFLVIRQVYRRDIPLSGIRKKGLFTTLFRRDGCSFCL